MAKDLTTEQFRESIKANLKNENLIQHSERRQPNDSPPTNNELFVANANKNATQYAEIITDILKNNS